MRVRSRSLPADITLWLAAIGLAVAMSTIASNGRGAAIITARLGLIAVGSPSVWPVIGAAALAALLVGVRRWVASRPWPVLQLLSGLAAGGWSTLLVLARHPAFPDEPRTAFFGAGYADALSSLVGVSPVLSALVVGLTAGAAVVLVNAAVQSLAGETQARRYACVAPLIPLAAWSADGHAALTMLWAGGVIALGAMASERGRGLAWSTGLGLISGLLLAGAALTSFAATATGIGLLCIYFLRRRSLMIIVSALGLVAGLGVAGLLGWSWPAQFGAESAARFASASSLIVTLILIAVLAVAAGGLATVESLRKTRSTPAWPLLVTALVGVVIGVFTMPAHLGPLAVLAPWQVFLMVACVAPDVPAGRPAGPSRTAAALTAVAGAMVTLGAVLAG